MRVAASVSYSSLIPFYVVILISVRIHHKTLIRCVEMRKTVLEGGTRCFQSFLWG